MRHRRLVVVVVAAVCLSWLAPTSVVGASPADANVSASVDESSVWVSESVDVTVTVENTGLDILRVSSVRLVDGTGTVRAERRDVERIGGQGRRQLTLEASIDEVGITELTAVVRFENGEETVRKTVTVTARDPTPLVDLSSERGTVPTQRTVRLTVGNPHDEPITRIEATLSGPASVELADDGGIVPTIPPGETRELMFEVRGVEPGRATFAVGLSFGTADGEFWTRNVTGTVRFADSAIRVSPSTAPVRLTGVDVGRSGEVSISGDVANTQDTALTGVLVRFPEELGSTDQQFVGSINGGEFAPFDPITATVPADRTTIPVEISYTVNDTRYTTVIELPLEGSGGSAEVPDFDAEGTATETSAPDQTDDGFPVPLVGVGGLAAVLIVLVGGVVYRRR